jgi:hypothetical protein
MEKKKSSSGASTWHGSHSTSEKKAVPFTAEELRPEIASILSKKKSITYLGVRRKLETKLGYYEGYLDPIKEQVNEIISSILLSPQKASSNNRHDSSLEASATMPRWVRDRDRQTCSICTNAFTLLNRRHHCRLCGEVVCSKCSPHKESIISPFLFDMKNEPVRVCGTCFDELPANKDCPAGPKQASKKNANAKRQPEQRGEGGGRRKDEEGEDARLEAVSSSSTGSGAAIPRSAPDTDNTLFWLTGTWEADEVRSATTLEPMMEALGVPWAARKLVNRMRFVNHFDHSSTEFVVSDLSTMRVKTVTYVLDGAVREMTNSKGEVSLVKAFEDLDSNSVTIETVLPDQRGKLHDTRSIVPGTNGHELRRLLHVYVPRKAPVTVDLLLVRSTAAGTGGPSSGASSGTARQGLSSPSGASNSGASTWHGGSHSTSGLASTGLPSHTSSSRKTSSYASPQPLIRSRANSFGHTKKADGGSSLREEMCVGDQNTGEGGRWAGQGKAGGSDSISVAGASKAAAVAAREASQEAARLVVEAAVAAAKSSSADAGGQSKLTGQAAARAARSEAETVSAAVRPAVWRGDKQQQGTRGRVSSSEGGGSGLWGQAEMCIQWLQQQGTPTIVCVVIAFLLLLALLLLPAVSSSAPDLCIRLQPREPLQCVPLWTCGLTFGCVVVASVVAWRQRQQR